MEKMTQYRILGRGNYYNSIIRLKNDDKIVEIGSKYVKDNFIGHPLMDLFYAVFYLIGGKPEIYVNPISRGELYFKDIEKKVSTEEALISGFGLKTPIHVNDMTCSPIESFSDRKLSGFEEIKKHPHKPKIINSVNQDLYEKWNKVEQKKILDEKPELIGLKIPEEEMTITMKFQKLPALEFLKEVSETYGIYPKSTYLYLNKNDGHETHAVMELKRGSKEILIKTCPIFTMDYCSGKTTEIYGRLI